MNTSIIIIFLIALVAAGIMIFKPEWANRALGALTAVAATLAAFGEKIMGMFGGSENAAAVIEKVTGQ